MEPKEQIKASLMKLIKRDGYVDVDRFIRWCIDDIYPRQKSAETLLRLALVQLIADAVNDFEEESGLDDIFIKGKERFHEYIVKKDDANSKKLAQEHHKTSHGPDHG